MKITTFLSGKLTAFAIFITIASFLFSCTDNKIGVTRESDIKNLPSFTGKEYRIVYTDSAKLQAILTTPLIERYTSESPQYWEFLHGINILFYEGKPDTRATLSAKYAKYHVDKNLWELRDSVVAESDKKLETELLYWDRTKDLIYTERFVKITKADETVMGTGFESNSRFDSYIIRNTSMIIYR